MCGIQVDMLIFYINRLVIFTPMVTKKVNNFKPKLLYDDFYP